MVNDDKQFKNMLSASSIDDVESMFLNCFNVRPMPHRGCILKNGAHRCDIHADVDKLGVKNTDTFKLF